VKAKNVLEASESWFPFLIVRSPAYLPHLVHGRKGHECRGRGTGADEDKKERKPTHRMTFVINSSQIPVPCSY
jgi:hypothetical protein